MIIKTQIKEGMVLTHYIGVTQYQRKGYIVHLMIKVLIKLEVALPGDK
jgi:hypothetical protein